MSDPVRFARSRLASASRRSVADPEKITQARRELSAAHVERAIQRALATAPPLTAEQRLQLASLLTSGESR